MSRDAGANWEDVTIPDLPEFALISILEPSAHDPGTAYVAATRYKLSDHAPYLYRTTDYGETWTQITTGIPDDDFTRVIREDPGRAGLLYAGTERGVYASFDAGDSWQPLSLNLPVVPIHDLVLRDGDLAAATHGRSFWVLDNVELLHQFTPGETAEALRLFRPRTTIRYNPGASPAALFSAMGRPGAGDPAGANPPDGAVIPYYLAEAAPEAVTLRILEDGALIREFSSASTPESGGPNFFGQSAGGGGLSAEAGAHTFAWDLRVEPAQVLDDAVFQGSATGPRVPPGDYTVELAIGDLVLSQPFSIVRDPRVDVTDGELREQFEFLLEARDRLTETMELVGRIRDMRGRAEQAVERGGGGDRLRAALAELNDQLYPVEERLVQYRARAGQDLIANATGIDSKLARLMGFASMGDGPPTQGQLDLLARLAEGIEARAAAIDEIERTSYAELARLVP
ncbi:WD40/YVTN/BNR-like repeat-containing protein [Candidatus Palauibacter sp.]|uniref:WD40/YVTN/BNR-like repeat-containing protein n=1 Tax=Candidatus Palauibacter sp. TaxID=3101350 RepID=UPI003B59595D